MKVTVEVGGDHGGLVDDDEVGVVGEVVRGFQVELHGAVFFGFAVIDHGVDGLSGGNPLALKDVTGLSGESADVCTYGSVGE